MSTDRTSTSTIVQWIVASAVGLVAFFGSRSLDAQDQRIENNAQAIREERLAREGSVSSLRELIETKYEAVSEKLNTVRTMLEGVQRSLDNQAQQDRDIISNDRRTEFRLSAVEQQLSRLIGKKEAK